MDIVDDYSVRYFDLTNDLMFKIVFGSKGNEKLLLCLLNALLMLKGKRQIKELEILNPINLPEFRASKESIIDIRACDKSGETYCVEMQIRANPELIKRILFYSAASFTRQISRGSKYSSLNKTVFLWIMCEKFLPEKEIYNKYLLKHHKNHHILTDLLEYHFVELEKFNKNKPTKLQTKFEKWLHLLKFGSFYRCEEQVPEDLKDEKEISEVIKRMIDANADKKMRYEMLNREIFLSDRATELDAAEKKGIEKGIESGKIEVALEMLADRMPIEKIVKYSGLSVEQIQALSVKNKLCEPKARYNKKKPKK